MRILKFLFLPVFFSFKINKDDIRIRFSQKKKNVPYTFEESVFSEMYSSQNVLVEKNGITLLYNISSRLKK